MRVALVGAELEENLGLRYMVSALARGGHDAIVVPFNGKLETRDSAQRVLDFGADIAGLSMVFTGRAREFCALAEVLREAGFAGHIIAGGHFASFNAERLLQGFPAFDSVGLGEGEEIICQLADHLDDYTGVAGLCFRRGDGSVQTNPSAGNPDDLDALAFPQRRPFHTYFGKPIASLLTSRGCWRNCAFCSINAWYKKGGGRKFRVRSVESVVAEMSELYHSSGVRIFNMQDDNFFLPKPAEALARFEALRDGLKAGGVEGIAIAVKARPDSITRDSIAVLDELGLFRVFLGVENASANGLRNLNRRCEVEQIHSALRILNDYDIHIAYNLLMFEPDTTMDDIVTNLRFMERNVENPQNFCRAEAYAGTGLERKLRADDMLLGDYFGYDYRLKDPRCEAFHQIANYAFFDRNFNDNGLHYFNMQVDFYFQLLRRFHPHVLTETVRAAVRNFIKRTNLDTYQWLSGIYDWVLDADVADLGQVRSFATYARERVDTCGAGLRDEGERILGALTEAYEAWRDGRPPRGALSRPDFALAGDVSETEAALSVCGGRPLPYTGIEDLARGQGKDALLLAGGLSPAATSRPIPYDLFRQQLDAAEEGGM